MRRHLLWTSFAVLALAAQAHGGLYGNDGKVGIWRGNDSNIASSTGENMVLRDVECGTRTLSDLWNGGGGGEGPYLREDEADKMECDEAQLLINALTAEATHSLIRLQTEGEDKILLKASGEIEAVTIEAASGDFDAVHCADLYSGPARADGHLSATGGLVLGGSITPTPTPGNLYLEGLVQHGSGTTRQFENSNVFAEYWDSGENMLVYKASGTPVVEFDLDDRYVGIKGGFGLETCLIITSISGTLRFFENGSTFTEFWNASDHSLSLNCGGNPAFSVDLDSGDTDITGDLGLCSDKSVRQPADAAGDGPNRASGLIGGIVTGFTMANNGDLEATGTGSYVLYLNSVHEELFGGTVVIDELEIDGVTMSSGAYIDEIILKRYDCSQPLGLVTVATHDTDIGNGTDGVFLEGILSADIPRDSNPGRLVLSFSVVDPSSAGVIVSDVRMKYHLE